MKNIIYAVIAASIAMLSTSGLVALAIAGEPDPQAEPLDLVVIEAVESVQADANDYISQFIDREYQKIIARQGR